MKHLFRLSDYSKEDIKEIFNIADQLKQGKYREFLKGKTIVMFFPESSIRTRVTFEKGIIRENFIKDRYLFVGANGNIGLAWKEASEVMGFSLEQCCPYGYEMPETTVLHNLDKAICDKDIICTDSLSRDELKDFADYQVTYQRMEHANKNAILNPCPPFYRGEEVSEDAIESKYFVGYEFKKSLLEIQQAVLIFNMMS